LKKQCDISHARIFEGNADTQKKENFLSSSHLKRFCTAVKLRFLSQFSKICLLQWHYKVTTWKYLQKKHDFPDRSIQACFHEINDKNKKEVTGFNQKRETPEHKNEETGEIEVIWAKTNSMIINKKTKERVKFEMSRQQNVSSMKSSRVNGQKESTVSA
jgi:hypothetical protein